LTAKIRITFELRLCICREA